MGIHTDIHTYKKEVTLVWVTVVKYLITEKRSRRMGTLRYSFLSLVNRTLWSSRVVKKHLIARNTLVGSGYGTHLYLVTLRTHTQANMYTGIKILGTTFWYMYINIYTLSIFLI